MSRRSWALLLTDWQSVLRMLPVLAAAMAGCDFPGRPDPAERPVPANETVDFKLLYGQNCAGCHGADGKLGPAPPLNDQLFRALVPLEELERIVSAGRDKTLMPAFAVNRGGTLTAVQIQVLVKEIKGERYKIVDKAERGKAVVADARGVIPQWGLTTKAPKGAPSYLGHHGHDPQGSKTRPGAWGNKERGAKVFARACAICHGDNGRGTGEGDDAANAIHDPVFLALISDQALRRYAITGRPDLGMPAFADPRPDDTNFKPLSDQDVTDLVALLASWRRDHGTNARP